MPVNFDKAFGIQDDALLLFERRTQLIAENIANADTPGYKARDIDFDQVLQNTKSSKGITLNKTNKGHIDLNQQRFSNDIQFREVEQSSADGNTVDTQKEKAAFAENSIRYQTTLNFLTRRISGLKTAFRGE
ncbi:Flagellar basal-body rod protein FlgB [hydrothermal vent metagenome]|uniref:Flagellar basal-body rod protein FlgB n=1 Tax=hydrothermal vent metagenome TaxID=652676 RepID=A0A3B0WQM9_9ZZZZ